MTRILITGATGYIGGQVLHDLLSSSPSLQVTALARSPSSAAKIISIYPSVKPLLADLADADVIEEAASQADVVLHLASSNHVASAEAIARGVTNSKRPKPVWIQIAGASILGAPEITQNRYGEPGSTYSDVRDLPAMHHLIATSPKRVVDRLVLNLSPSSSTTTSPFSSSSSAAGSNIRTALLYGPMIYGLGVGPGNTRSIQLPTLAASTLHRGYAPYVGQGLNAWSHVHVSDVSALAVKLVHASMGEEDDGLWNKEGVYFPEADKVTFKTLAEKLAAEATSQNLVPAASTKSITPDAADRLTPLGSVLLGTNAQTQGDRARLLLGWKPHGPSLDDEIERALLEEAGRNNIILP